MIESSTIRLFVRRDFCMDLQSDICIIGNGAVGKTAALGFAQLGLSVTLLGPSVAPSTVTPNEDWDVRVFALNHVAQELLSSLRVWDALDASRVAVDAMQVNGDGAEHAGHLGFDAYGARVGALTWIVEDRNLNQALDAALKFAPKGAQRGRAATQLDGGARARWCNWKTAIRWKRRCWLAPTARNRGCAASAISISTIARTGSARSSPISPVPRRIAASPINGSTQRKALSRCCHCRASACRWCGRRPITWPRC